MEHRGSLLVPVTQPMLPTGRERITFLGELPSQTAHRWGCGLSSRACRGCCCCCTTGCCCPQSHCALGLETQSDSTHCSEKGTGLLQMVRDGEKTRRDGWGGRSGREGGRQGRRGRQMLFTEVPYNFQAMVTLGGGDGAHPSYQSQGSCWAALLMFIPLRNKYLRQTHGSFHSGCSPQPLPVRSWSICFPQTGDGWFTSSLVLVFRLGAQGPCTRWCRYYKRGLLP